MTPDALELAHVIAGEAGTCGIVGLLAVAWIYQRNTRMNGYASPNYAARWVAENYTRFPDPTGGRRFVFSAEDMRLPAVQRIIAAEGRAPPVVVECRRGLKLWIW